MKKLYIILAAVLSLPLLASCSDDLGIETEVNKGLEVVATGKLQVTGTINKDPETRVSFADGGTSITPSWEVGDQVFGFWGENTLTYQVASVADGVASFTLVNGTEPTDGTTVHMIYAPSKSVTDISSQQLAIDLSQQAGTLAGLKNHAIMCATATVDGSALSLQFKNQVAIVGVKQFTGLKPNTTYSMASFSAYGPTAKLSLVNGVLRIVTDDCYGKIKATGTYTTDESGNTTTPIYFAVPPHDSEVPHTFVLSASDDCRTGSISARNISVGKYLYMTTKQMEESSLVQHWAFDGNTDNEVSAISAVLESSAPTLTTDRFGNANSAYYFDGTNKMTVPEAGFNFGTNSFTANVWINTSSTNVTLGIIRSDNAYAGSNGCLLRLNYGCPEIWEGRTSDYVFVSSQAVNDGEWHMLTYVRDVDQRKGSLYIDGSYVGGYNITGAVNNVTRMLSIGFIDRYDFMIGKIDDLQLYSKALSAKQIAQLYTPAPQAPTSQAPLNGRFSVSSTEMVCFAPGNIQYQASTGLWRFANHQYSFVGNAPGNSEVSNRETQSDRIDWFGWGATGCNVNGAFPYDISFNNSHFKTVASASGSESLTIDNAADWGYAYNSTYGVQGWFTMSWSQWDYLLNTRPTSTIGGVSNARFAKVAVNGVHGLLLFPDSFTWNTATMGTEPTNINSATRTWSTDYSIAQFEAMENAGVAFIPASGYHGKDDGIVSDYGAYWTSDAYNAERSVSFDFSSSKMQSYNTNRSTCCAVRLVKYASKANGTSLVSASAGRPGNTCDWVVLWQNSPKFATMLVGSTEADYTNCTSYSVAYCGDMYSWNANAATTVWGSNWETATLDDYDQLYAGLYTSSKNDIPMSSSTPNVGTNCIWEWMDGSSKQFTTGCTLKGWKISGKGIYAANSIFLPLSGCNGSDRAGSIGVYYTGTSGYRLYFDSGNIIDMRTYTGDRYHVIAKLSASASILP